jgi:hypothetical protein
MKQGQYGMTRLSQNRKWHQGDFPEAFCYTTYAPVARRSQNPGFTQRLGRLVVSLLTLLWSLVTLPLRFLIGIIGLLGRLTGIVLGFALMVIGMALWAGPLFILGIPLFIIGLLLTLRCLE